MTGGDRYDVAIVGGGPAGLSAAFWLARYRRRVLVFDAGRPRNEPTWAVHGYPGLPDLPPLELRRRLRDQALGTGAEVRETAVTAVEGGKNGFLVRPSGEPPVLARRLLLAFGRKDVVPEIPGLDEAYGVSVFHCPDCDGPSLAGARVGVLGHGRAGAAVALFLRTWTDRLTLLTDGREPGLDDRARSALEREAIPVRTEPVRRIVHRGGRIERLELEGAPPLELDGLLFHLGSLPGSDLAGRLGCESDRDAYLRVDASQETSVPGVFAAGDAAGHPHLAIAAAAEGVRAALAIHRSLLPAEWEV